MALHRTERAHAKVNLILRVGPGEPDGYHPVVTVLHFLELHDLVHLDVEPHEETEAPAGPSIRVTADRPGIPEGPANLAWRAAEALGPAMRRAGLASASIRIHIEKRIPTAAGLAGGSADAAAVLRGLNRLLRLGLDADALASLGASLGSDVPAGIAGGTVTCAGRGERIVARMDAKPFWWVLANPGRPLATKEVYAAFDRLEGAHEAPRFGEASMVPPEHPAAGDLSGSGLRAALEAGDPHALVSLLRNDLQPAACRLMPEISHLLTGMIEEGALAAQVSGSGPTVFGLAAGREDARALAARLRRRGVPWVWHGSSVVTEPDHGGW